ncbi:putative ccch zinc finger protein [Diplodia seriata]|uniref:Putative ccch zinc finger protein n=1 Tax=Diplodia seriata TaxID=420778 RepID=A0A0G2HC66_9PEZI|nr:putative ccch zinc finger protein [Diplodia seriata]
MKQKLKVEKLRCIRYESCLETLNMSEDSELQAKIAALAGRINVHKQQQQQQNDDYQPPTHYGNPAKRTARHHEDSIADTGQGRGRGRGGWAPYRGTPYGAPRGRGGKVFNRTLVLNNNRASSASSADVTSPTNGTTAAGTPSPLTNEPSGWVVKRDRHMQLINPAIYDQVAQQRAKDIEQSAEQRRQQRNLKEKARLSKHFQIKQEPGHAPIGSHAATTTQNYEIEVDNIRFRVTDGGSKLVRISNDPNTARATPKQAKIGGVTFLRSKNGNLYRSGLIKNKQNKPIKKINEPCPRFTTTGWPFPSHSKDKREGLRLAVRFVYPTNAKSRNVAICKDYLLRGNCALGDGCDLSHDPTPNRVPACVHFMRGNCTNDDCHYAHIRVNPTASVCRAFGTLGYCEKGSDCAERHVFECPDYANHAVCRNPKCRLPHVDRAGQIRKAAAAQTASAELGSPDLSSDDEYDEIDSDDVDSDDGIEEDIVMQGSGDNGQELSRQQDFVGF